VKSLNPSAKSHQTESKSFFGGLIHLGTKFGFGTKIKNKNKRKIKIENDHV
jgi:hypothetical protein